MMRPTIFWVSDPVAPDETLLLTGDGFDQNSVVEFKRADESDWSSVEPLQRSDVSLKAVVPADWEMGTYVCRVRNGEHASAPAPLNAPDIWWTQGSVDCNTSCPGGWLRCLGKCLHFGATSLLELQAVDGPVHKIEATVASGYSLEFPLPVDLPVGDYHGRLFNGLGWSDLPSPIELRLTNSNAAEVNVLDFGADPSGKNDSQNAILRAVCQLGCHGGGTVYFPRGRYRLDPALCSWSFNEVPLTVPENITLRGEGMDLVSLWWPDRDEPPFTYILASRGFRMEEMTLYTQGKHAYMLWGASDTTLKRVRMYARGEYLTVDPKKPFHGRVTEPEKPTLVEVRGDRFMMTECDLGNGDLQLRGSRGSVIANNRLGKFRMDSCRELICERNHCKSIALAIFTGMESRHAYLGENTIAEYFWGDREAITTDGHGTAWMGGVETCTGTAMRLAESPPLGAAFKDNMPSLAGAYAFILAGRGMGQYRRLLAGNGSEMTLEKEWAVAPDNHSVVSIAKFNGRHLIVGNTARDTGTAGQLYPPNIECVVADNTSIRANGLNSLSHLALDAAERFVRVEPSWYHLFLDNRVEVGNGWGGGETEVNGWIGGESRLLIYGYYTLTDENGVGRLMNEADAARLPNRQLIPLSAFQVVRRHRVDNNSYIQLRGLMRDIVVEGCVICQSPLGIKVDAQIQQSLEDDTSCQLKLEPEPTDANTMKAFAPRLVLLRANRFEDVDCPFSGCALENAQIVDPVDVQSANVE